MRPPVARTPLRPRRSPTTLSVVGHGIVRPTAHVPAPVPRPAFALVELLVVIGIIGLLLAVLLPAAAAARAESRAILCLSNIRQLSTAVAMYANDSANQYPPTYDTPSPGMYWYDEERVGGYLSASTAPTGGRTVLSCPADEEGGERSYAMNVWVSARADPTYTVAPIRGTFWRPGNRNAERMILLTECWSTLAPFGDGWYAPGIVGFRGLTPGQRFGVGIGANVTLPTKRYGKLTAKSQLPFHRHRTRLGGRIEDPVGRVAIAFADGHADFRSNTDLADATTGLSTLNSLWSLLDDSLNR